MNARAATTADGFWREDYNGSMRDPHVYRVGRREMNTSLIFQPIEGIYGLP